MKQPTPDQEYPSQIWVPPFACEHPHERLTFTGNFPQENYNLSVFNANCLQCGASWNQTDTDAPWTQLMEKLALGEFGVVSFEDDDIAHKVDRRRKLRYDVILNDAYGDPNPILSPDAPTIRRPD